MGLMREPRDQQITIRIPTRIRAALEQEADHERRTVADIINLALEARYPLVPRESPQTKVRGWRKP